MIVGLTAGWDRAINYLLKGGAADRGAEQLRLARVDYWSYLLTSVPLFSALVFAMNRDPLAGGLFNPNSDLTNVLLFNILLVATAGVGAGLARRSYLIRRAKGEI
jgi:hypothetical protein